MLWLTVTYYRRYNASSSPWKIVDDKREEFRRGCQILEKSTRCGWPGDGNIELRGFLMKKSSVSIFREYSKLLYGLFQKSARWTCKSWIYWKNSITIKVGRYLPTVSNYNLFYSRSYEKKNSPKLGKSILWSLQGSEVLHHRAVHLLLLSS